MRVNGSYGIVDIPSDFLSIGTIIMYGCMIIISFCILFYYKS